MHILESTEYLACQNSLGESPVWCPVQQALFWVDISQSVLHKLKDNTHHSYPLTQPVTAFALSDKQQFVSATNNGFAYLHCHQNKAAQPSISPFLQMHTDFRMNDAALDRQGRFWSGSIQQAPLNNNATGQLYCLDSNITTAVLSGFCSQNGLAWSPDGNTMYVSDSHASCAAIWQYDFDIETGTPSNRQLFASQQDLLTGRPDGATVDTDGCYWIAASDIGQVLRLTPKGIIDTIIKVPTAHVTNVCFGGADLKRLFITTQRYLYPNEQAGNLFVVDTPYQGIAETAYKESSTPSSQTYSSTKKNCYFC